MSTLIGLEFLNHDLGFDTGESNHVRASVRDQIPAIAVRGHSQPIVTEHLKAHKPILEIA